MHIIDGSDYSPRNETLEFNPDISSVRVRIAITPDNLVELTESFFTELAIIFQQGTENGNIVLCQNRAEITILDDDSKSSITHINYQPNIVSSTHYSKLFRYNYLCSCHNRDSGREYGC